MCPARGGAVAPRLLTGEVGCLVVYQGGGIVKGLFFSKEFDALVLPYSWYAK